MPKHKHHAPPLLPVQTAQKQPHTGEAVCKDCDKKGKNPLTCLLEALRNRKDSGFDAEDFLLLGLIALLIGKEGNEDIVFILAMLLLM